MLEQCLGAAPFTAQRASFRSANGMLSPRRTNGSPVARNSRENRLFTAGMPISFTRLEGMLPPAGRLA